MSESEVKTGQCLCGAVKYQVRNAGVRAVITPLPSSSPATMSP